MRGKTIAAVIAITLGFLSGCTNKEENMKLEKEHSFHDSKQNALNIVARKDYDIPIEYHAKNIMGKNFWNCLRPINKNYIPKSGDILKEEMVSEAILNHVIPADKLWSQIGNIPQSKNPFLITVPPSFSIFRNNFSSQKNVDEYMKFTTRHTNFIGFRVSEWDNFFLCCQNEKYRNSHADKYDKKTINNIREIFSSLKTKEQLVMQTQAFYKAMDTYLCNDSSKITFMNAGWRFDHYPLEWGARGGTAIETTATGPYKYQISLFFARGASRQYNVPWQWYIALFYNGYEKNGNLSKGVPDFIRENNSPVSYGNSPILRGINNGIPISLDKRTRYLAFLSGASIIESESWPYAYCTADMTKGNLKLSPLGEIMKEWYSYTARTQSRGISYAPIALILPFQHAYNLKNFAVNSLEKRSSQMTDAIMKTLVPETVNLKKGMDGCLSNSPYGDIYDVLVQEKSGFIDHKVLNNYKVVFLTGNIKITDILVKTLEEYVQNGGTLIINSKQLNEAFEGNFLGASLCGETHKLGNKIESLIPDGPTLNISDGYEYEKMTLKTAIPILKNGNETIACLNKYGKGNVILCSVDYLIPRMEAEKTKKYPFLDFFFSNIVKEVLPVEIQGNIEYGLNRLDDGWIVYLINNRGVYKFPCSPQELNIAETSQVKITLKKDIAPIEIKNLKNNQTIALKETKNSFDITVPPGEISIVKIKTRPDKKEGK